MLKQTYYNENKVREALDKERQSEKWHFHVAGLLRLCGIPKNNFYDFLRCKRGFTQENYKKLLNVFQLDERKFRNNRRRKNEC